MVRHVWVGNSWNIQACGRTSGCAANTVNTTPDTGPVVCHSATGCWVEGARIDGGLGIDYADNWNAVRLENCTSCTVRNIDASNFTRDAVAGNTNHNQSIVTLYGSLNSVVEHNTGRVAGAGIYFKDTDTTNPQSGNIIRYNRFDSVGEVIAFSITAEGRNYIYQNIGTNELRGGDRRRRTFKRLDLQQYILSDVACWIVSQSERDGRKVLEQYLR